VSHHRPTLALLGATLVATLGFALTASSALAARGHAFGYSFGGPGTGDGQLNEPRGLAVNEETGDVYVVDDGNNRVEVFSATGIFEGQFDGSGTFEMKGKVETGTAAGGGGLPGEIPTGKFSRPEGIAVDNSCYLHEPEPLTEASTPVTCKEFDPSNGDVYVIDHQHRVIDKFSSTGAYIGQVPRGPEAEGAPSFALEGIAVDTRGELWVLEEWAGASEEGEGVDNYSNAAANVWREFRSAFLFAFFDRHGLAVDAKDKLYVRINANVGEGPPVVEFNSKGEVLSKAVCDEPPSAVAAYGVATESVTDDVYIDNIDSVDRCDPSGAPVEHFGEGHLTSHSSESGGLAVNSSTGTVYVADGVTNVIDGFPLEPPAAPKIQTESVSDVTATSAALGAEINPRSELGEAPTSYRIEYGPCATLATCASSPYETSIPIPDGQLSPDFEVHDVSERPTGLQPHTAYHFRVVAGNSHPGGAEGEERTFTTQTAGAFALPDGRAWEMVSPPDKHGALLEPITEQGVAQAAAGGAAIVYQASAPTEAEPQGNTNFVQVLSTRGPTGWGSLDLAAPHTEATGLSLGLGEEYRFFSADLSLGVLQPFGSFNQELSPQASEQTAYLRSDYLNGNVDEPCLPTTMRCYSPLVTGCPPAGEECSPVVEEHANVPPGTVFGIDQETGKECPPRPRCGPQFLGATPDLGHVVLRSRVALTESHTSARGALYEWSVGRPPAEQVQLVSVLPDHKPASAAANLGFETRQGGQVARHAISDDGSRIVWSELEVHLYMRDMARGDTVPLDAVEGGTGQGLAEPRFQIASSDDSKVFFTDEQRLTADSGAQSGQPDLYECEIVEAAGELECRLTDLTPARGGESADVQGTVLGAGEDGSTVYFVANGVLAPGASPGDCSGGAGSSFTGACNLYMRDDGATSLIAVLSGKDYPDFASFAGLSGLTARVSPDGRWLAFMSQLPLSGYDNRDAVSGRRDEEVYLFDAARPVSEGNPEAHDNPVCVSCDPTGARPHGVEYSHLNDQLVGGDRVWEASTWLAANVPGWTPYRLSAALYQSRYLSNSGRLFFNSSDALVAQDTNGNEDVYEYDPTGVGGCERSSATLGEASGGCVGLVSSGTSAGESAFLDASENGDDVFFLTAAQLAAQDFDTSLDVYDAHVCGSASPCPSPPPPPLPACEGDACQSPVIAPNDPTPGSLTFQGPGNTATAASNSAVRPKSLTRAQKLARALKACRKKPKKKTAACERQARRAYGSTSKAARSRKGAGR
jgi:DNA-binding beta-propeller fold protein YncE